MSTSDTATIRAVQSALRRRHYYHGQVDGFFGQATAVAIERFQMNHDLYVKGVIDRQLLDALVCGNNVMAIGARGAAVRLLGRQVPRDFSDRRPRRNRVARWKCHDGTTVALDQAAFIDAIVDLIERQETEGSAAPQLS
jgi:peptidoglycan hydrolase-like protein with peptidoglycan-binding domain